MLSTTCSSAAYDCRRYNDFIWECRSSGISALSLKHILPLIPHPGLTKDDSWGAKSGQIGLLLQIHKYRISPPPRSDIPAPNDPRLWDTMMQHRTAERVSIGLKWHPRARGAGMRAPQARGISNRLLNQSGEMLPRKARLTFNSGSDHSPNQPGCQPE